MEPNIFVETSHSDDTQLVATIWLAGCFQLMMLFLLAELDSLRDLVEMDKTFGPTEQVVWPLSILCGIIMCKIVFPLFGTAVYGGAHVYEITGAVSSLYFKSYAKLSKAEKIEWNNRGFSSFHAILVAAVSFHLIVITDLFKDDYSRGLITERKSLLSDSIFGISIGYFLTDLAMILWLFPALGGKEYILHHGLSLYSIILAFVSGTAHVYILMVVFSEITTPLVNLRWYLDRAGQKNSTLYLCNGLALFLGWLVARILLFIYFFLHMYLHFDQVRRMFTLGFYTLLTTPSLLAAMNVFWFWKIVKGLKKTVSRKRHLQ